MWLRNCDVSFWKVLSLSKSTRGEEAADNRLVIIMHAFEYLFFCSSSLAGSVDALGHVNIVNNYVMLLIYLSVSFKIIVIIGFVFCIHSYR